MIPWWWCDVMWTLGMVYGIWFGFKFRRALR